MGKLLLKRGLNVNLPTLAEAELGFATDTKKLYIGSSDGNIELTGAESKAPISHASAATTYGVGTTTTYGHCKTINALTTSSHSNGLALSAYQGKVLSDAIAAKANATHSHSMENEGWLQSLVITLLNAAAADTDTKASIVTSTAAPTTVLAANVLHCVYS
jgi:hypothetical protein